MIANEWTQKFASAAKVICKQGIVPFSVSDTVIEIVRRVVGDNEAELDLICAFEDKPSQVLDQLVASSGMPAETVASLADSLAAKGVIFNQPNSAGIMVYRILPLMLVGVMEYKFMVPLQGTAEERELAELFERLLQELRTENQGNYDALIPIFNAAPSFDRTVPAQLSETGERIKTIPVNRRVDVQTEVILPSQTVAEIIDKFDDIAVSHCFCRQRRGLLGDACETDAPTLNCFTFGKSARHTTAQGFAQKISKDQAHEIMQAAEAAGLIHKAFHPGSNSARPETSICNCCKDCCDTFSLWRNGTLPLINSTYHLAVIDPHSCSGCETCIDWCPVEAIGMNDAGLAVRDADTCIGCGVCARFCPEQAISLQEGLRKVLALPPRVR